MTKAAIIDHLKTKHEEFSNLIVGFTDADFMLSTNGKWTAGQQLEHILLSVQPLEKALKLPKFLLRYKFGKANRPSKSYEELVKKYETKLAEGGKAPSRFVPPTVYPEQKAALKEKLLQAINKLIKRVNRYSEEQLDNYILPHPLLGVLTLREMLYFTIHHVQHHHNMTLKNLQA